MPSTTGIQKDALGLPAHARPPHIDTRNDAPFDSRSTERLVPMRALVLGLCRTGTSSLREALLALGYTDVYHMSSLESADAEVCNAWIKALEQLKLIAQREEDTQDATQDEQDFWDRMTGHVDSVTDVPCALFYRQLLRVYPDAPVILSIRSPVTAELSEARHLHGASAFAKSCQDTILTMRRRVWFMTPSRASDIFTRIVPVPRQILVRRQTLSVLFGNNSFQGHPAKEIQHAKAVYKAHNASVVKLCERLGRKVLVYDVKESWEPLVTFLNENSEDDRVQAPLDAQGDEVPFPRLNDTATFHKVVGEKAQALRSKARGLLVKVGTFVVGSVIVITIAVLLRR